MTKLMRSILSNLRKTRLNALHVINVFHKDELSYQFLTEWWDERALYDRSLESKTNNYGTIGAEVQLLEDQGENINCFVKRRMTKMWKALKHGLKVHGCTHLSYFGSVLGVGAGMLGGDSGEG